MRLVGGNYELKKQDSVYARRLPINTVLQFVKSPFYNIAISFFDNPVALAITRKSTPSSFKTFAIRIFSSLLPSAFLQLYRQP